MKGLDQFFTPRDLEVYAAAFLFLFLCWFLFNTLKYYRKEKRKVKNLHRFASEGEPQAQHELAKRYHHGKMVKKNCQKAAFWYQKAAFTGNEQAKGYLEIFLKNHKKNKKNDQFYC
ncbi:MAG: hypothetical protein QG564_1438 [Campylobacterota bacterium]|nr:hypothetical protein [Campylobacterota bacterium]